MTSRIGQFSGGLIVAVLGLSCVMRESNFAVAQSAPNTAEMEASLRDYLRQFYNDRTTRYTYALRDLNRDGRPEAIVYVAGASLCGSGGCVTLVLTQDRLSWRVVGRIPISRPPIRVLNQISNGWRDLSVWVQGGGIQPGYDSELSFDGKAYPSNPSIPPSRRLDAKAGGQIVISSDNGGIALYP